MTERDYLREENQRLINKIDSIVAMVLRLKLDKDTIINSVRELKNRLCGKLEVYSALTIQSIWRALKVRRVFNEVRRTTIRAVIIIQRNFRICSDRMTHIKE